MDIGDDIQNENATFEMRIDNDKCRDAAKIDWKRQATSTKVRRVAGACQSALHALNPQPTATAAPVTYTGQPSIITQFTVLALRVARAVLAPFGLNPITLLTPLLVSDSPP
jgi:hypothetical protein